MNCSAVQCSAVHLVAVAVVLLLLLLLLLLLASADASASTAIIFTFFCVFACPSSSAMPIGLANCPISPVTSAATATTTAVIVIHWCATTASVTQEIVSIFSVRLYVTGGEGILCNDHPVHGLC